MAWITAAVALAIAFTAVVKAQEVTIEVQIPTKAPVIPEVPARNPIYDNGEAGEHADHGEEITQEEQHAGKHAVEETDDEETVSSDDTGTAGSPPLPSKKPQRAGARIVSDKPIGPPPRPAQWSDQDIAKARARCENLLSDAIFEFKPLEPIREGVCGTPAPVELNSVSAGQTVTIRPAAKLNCNMASQFHRWMVEIVQPGAKAYLDTEIAGVINVASYHCRTRYNDPGQRMSQHAFANALDVAGFITAKGVQIDVERFWEGDTPQSHFLREIHDGACKIFGTVLGPEANAAHHNHFHLDMTKRRHGSYCQ
ncbi:MAG TPA: extensin family protein [Hyphomicrobiales bacterium]|nr:extensin family protein [Hyphomicrobiales bacterium]